MTKKEADNIIKFITDRTWHGYSCLGSWGYFKSSDVVDVKPLVAKIKRMIE